MLTTSVRRPFIYASKPEMGARCALFRQEAIEFQQHHGQWGEVTLLQPPSTKIMAWFIFGAVALTIIFLFLGQYARKETVVGYLLDAIIGNFKGLRSPAGHGERDLCQGGRRGQKRPAAVSNRNQPDCGERSGVNITMLATLESLQNAAAQVLAVRIQIPYYARLNYRSSETL